MTNDQRIQHSFEGDICKLRVPLLPKVRPIENIRNCDIFVEENNLLIYADVRLYKFNTTRQFDIRDMKNLTIKFSTKERCYELQLPCLAITNDDATNAARTKIAALEKKLNKAEEHCPLDLWKLKRITDCCKLQIDGKPELLNFEANFYYGFASNFKGRLTGECDLPSSCNVAEPHLTSPLQRSVNREIDELKNFSREEYKLNFVELQLPEGHDNPMKFFLYFNDAKLSKDEDCLLHNLTRKPEDMLILDPYYQNEVDCGLISILLAICYDVRTTSNEPTCESAWTRSILSATLSYLEPFHSIKDVVISFWRRALIYPLYRNYDLARQCLHDAIKVMHRSRAWLLKQLLVTHTLLSTNECSGAFFNRYYIEDYIRYVHNEDYFSAEHMRMLTRNLKNVQFDIFKKHLGLDLCKIETELLKELITDIQISSTEDNSSDDDDDDVDNEDDDDGITDSGEDDGITDSGDDVITDSGDDVITDSGEDETESSSASEAEENSVIEQRISALKIYTN